MPKGVLTEYKVGESKYNSYILCNSMDAGWLLAKKRNIGESVLSQVMEITDPIPDFTELPDSEFIERLPEIAHSTAFLSFIGVKSGNITIEDVVGDEGALHEMIHVLSGASTVDATTLKAKLTVLQKQSLGSF